MTSMNVVCLVGTLVRRPEILETAAKKKYAKFQVETEKFVRVGGEQKRISALHTVVCFNHFSLPGLERFGSPGARVRVQGELQYDRNGAQIQVPLYGGEVGIMDVAQAADQPAENAGRKPQSTPSGGLGKLSQGAKDEPGQDRQPAGKGGLSASAEDSEADSIPF